MLHEIAIATRCPSDAERTTRACVRLCACVKLRSGGRRATIETGPECGSLVGHSSGRVRCWNNTHTTLPASTPIRHPPPPPVRYLPLRTCWRRFLAPPRVGGAARSPPDRGAGSRAVLWRGAERAAEEIQARAERPDHTRQALVTAAVAARRGGHRRTDPPPRPARVAEAGDSGRSGDPSPRRRPQRWCADILLRSSAFTGRAG